MKLDPSFSQKTEASGKSGTRVPLLLLPALIWFLFFLGVPLLLVVVYSFAQKGLYGGVIFKFSLENFVRAGDWLYLKILLSSVKLALLTTALCFVFGFPLAYLIATLPKKWRPLAMICVVLPFWTNFVVRVYAIQSLLSEVGPLSRFLQSNGWIDAPLALSGTPFAVGFGMLSNYLPFMVLPLISALDRFDFSLLEAARDLGATRWGALIRVLFPLTRSGWIAGSVFVFTPALGEFVIPDLLGGAQSMMIGNLVTDQFLKSRDWPFGSAISILMMGLVTLCLFLYLRSSSRKGVYARS